MCPKQYLTASMTCYSNGIQRIQSIGSRYLRRRRTSRRLADTRRTADRLRDRGGEDEAEGNEDAIEVDWSFRMGLEALNKWLTTELDSNASMLLRARQVAVRAHRNQTRWNGDAYITHPMRVASKFKDPIVKAIAYLHDVVEDTKLTLDDLKRFGFCQEILDGVEAVTKRDGEPYLDFVLRVKGNIKSRSVKIADIEDNLSDLTDRNKTMRDKYQLALWILERT